MNQRERDGIVEQRLCPWCSKVTVVVKSDGTPCFCVDYRYTINESVINEDVANGKFRGPSLRNRQRTRYSRVRRSKCYHQMPVAASEQDKIAFVTQNRKSVLRRPPLGIATAPLLFSRLMLLAVPHFGLNSGLLVHMDDCTYHSPPWKGNPQLLDNMFFRP